MKNLCLILVCAFLLVGMENLSATHNRAGEITYVQTGPLTIRATITTYTRTSSFAADRDSLEMFWGDGQSQYILRSNGKGEELPNDIKVNYYIAEHTYPTRGMFTMSVVDPNRIAGILNIDFPNSVNIQFYIETSFTLLDLRFQGKNSSAVLLQPPIDYACIGEVFTHNPNAFDPDGDSLAYELITPLQEPNVKVPNYQLPDRISPGPDNNIYLNPLTGDFIWDSPKVTGEFNITYRIKEYRESVLINSIIRDMQILVRTCPDRNRPPELSVPEEICVLAGDTIEFEIVATDPDSNEIIEITALGGPFVLDHPATITKGFLLPVSRTSVRFKWITNCDHISPSHYQIVVKASDELNNENSGLATLKTIRIKVVGPEPRDPQAVLSDGAIKLSWESPYVCEESAKFLGFSVWRRESADPVAIDSCNPSIAGLYERVIILTNQKEGDRYAAIDPEIDAGRIYCYRIVAEYALFSDSNNPFNRSQSIPSTEICIRSSFLDPLITKVSVLNTSNLEGRIEINWIPPDPLLIDTVEFPAPYSIQLLQGESFAPAELKPLENYDYFSVHEIRDTLYIAAGLNTSDNPYIYQMEFTSGLNSNFASLQASSVFLRSIGRDRKVDLSWEHNVPWSNEFYEIYETDPVGGEVLLGSTSDKNFTITNLENGTEYCYKIRSYGSLKLSGVIEPIINDSQLSCATAVDTIPPCTPELSVSTVCNSPEIEESDFLFNRLSWKFPATCNEITDLERFNIFYFESAGSSGELIGSIAPDTKQYDHVFTQYLSGCYGISAVDSSGNESALSSRICIENCPDYELPNTFTPNEDGANDFFKPLVNRFVEAVRFEVYNRWGQKVFETSDPVISWNGENLSGKRLSDGVYFYVCEVFVRSTGGELQSNRLLQGSINLLR